jgi:D-3-phosphoglycerate dehydrogenase
MVARIGSAFHMKAIGYDPLLSKEELQKAHITKIESLDSLVQQADFISLHVPHIKQTHHIINDAVLNHMKPTAFLINCARGGVVDEDALFTALKEGKLAGAALDVYEQEPPGTPKLTELENVVFSPHLGAATVEGQVRAGTVCAEQVLKVLHNEEPDFWVNRL